MVYDVRRNSEATQTVCSVVFDGHGGDWVARIGQQSYGPVVSSLHANMLALRDLAVNKPGENAKKLKNMLNRNSFLKITDLLSFFYDDQDRWFGKKGGFRSDSFKTKLAKILFPKMTMPDNPGSNQAGIVKWSIMQGLKESIRKNANSLTDIDKRAIRAFCDNAKDFQNFEAGGDTRTAMVVMTELEQCLSRSSSSTGPSPFRE